MTRQTSLEAAYPPVPVRRSDVSLKRWLGNDWQLAYVLLAPTMAVIVGLIAYPLITAFLLSFQNKPIGVEGEFVGFDNYVALLNDRLFQRAATNTAIYTVAAVGFKFLIGLVAALVVHEAVHFNNLFRALLVLPWATPVVVGAFAWRWILDEGRGILNHGLFTLGLVDFPPLWLVDPRIALWAVIAVVVWQGMPFYMLNFLAGLSSIDRSLYEAAAIDGAGPVQSFLHVTLPGLKSVIVITLLISTIWTSAAISFVFVLTNGGPANATQILPMLSYTSAIQLGDLGKGAATALATFPLLAPIIVILTRRLLRKDD